MRSTDFVGPGLQVGSGREPHAVATEDLTLVGEVDGRHLDALARDVLPDVHLGPVGDGEDAHVLARRNAAVVERPQLRALRPRLPLPELVTQREDALLGTRLFLVAPSAAEDGIELVLGDGIEQRDGLQAVARRVARLFAARGPCRWIPGRWPRPGARPSRRRDGRGTPSTSGKLCPVSICISGKGNLAGRKAFSAMRSITIESLPPENSSAGPLELGRDLAHDEDGLCLEGVQVGDRVPRAGARRWAGFDHLAGTDLASHVSWPMLPFPDRIDRHYRDTLGKAEYTHGTAPPADAGWYTGTGASTKDVSETTPTEPGRPRQGRSKRPPTRKRPSRRRRASRRSCRASGRRSPVGPSRSAIASTSARASSPLRCWRSSSPSWW